MACFHACTALFHVVSLWMQMLLLNGYSRLLAHMSGVPVTVTVIYPDFDVFPGIVWIISLSHWEALANPWT
jgi:hypothetical protein